MGNGNANFQEAHLLYQLEVSGRGKKCTTELSLAAQHGIGMVNSRTTR